MILQLFAKINTSILIFLVQKEYGKYEYFLLLKTWKNILFNK